MSPFWANILCRSIVYSFIFKNVFFWISFLLNEVSESSPVRNSPFHRVEEYNTQSGQILRFKDAIFFFLFCKSYCLKLIALRLITIHYLLYCRFRYCINTIWNSIKILCQKNSKMYIFLAFSSLKFYIYFTVKIAGNLFLISTEGSLLNKIYSNCAL